MSAVNSSIRGAARRQLCLAALLSSLALRALAGDSAPLALRGALDQPVPFQGAISYDSAGSAPGAPLYVAPGVAGLLVAIAVHAVVANQVETNEQKRMRVEADRILLPHRATLNAYRQADLLLDAAPLVSATSSLRVLGAGTRSNPEEVLVDVLPSFKMTQDRRALVLDNTVAIMAAGRATPYQTVIRVVSPARDAQVTDQFWFDNDATMLRQVSSTLLARSVDIAVNEMRRNGASGGQYKTVRYSEGGAERIERAEILATTCDQLVLRTLRGHLMAVPRPAAPQPAPECTEQVQET